MTAAGMMAEYDEPRALLAAARAAYAHGYRRLNAYSPFPIEGLAEAVGGARDVMGAVVLGGSVIGCVGGYYLQYYASAVSYPLIVAGRPFNSWPAFIPVTFELTVLCGALAAVLGLLAVCGLPRPHHPAFGVPSFEFATHSRFYLYVEADDPLFDPAETRKFLEGTKPRGVYAVEE